jgi:HicA toxin of bacterial toxin-antitoxin,
MIALVESRGWRLARTRGSHRQYHHPTQPGTVTLAGKLIREAIPFHLEGLRGNGDPIPEPTTRIEFVDAETIS